MAAKIRLARAGAKKKPFYRIIVTDSRSKRDGDFLEQVGTYDPRPVPPAINLKVDRIKHWLSHGVQATDTVKRLFKQHGLADPPAQA
ncbi:MAG: 30S ribosomal protein S16 [Pseudomonadota bacterium]